MAEEAFSGFEPQVGEIMAVRSFRIGFDGVLFPLFSGTPWLPGDNLARCALPANEELPHRAAEPECTCGFYAYGMAEAAAEYPHARHVLAIVACWGHVIAGTRGLRSEHARVEAIWMSPTVPRDLAEQVGARYPDVAVYSDRAAMLCEHPPTALDCYETPAEGHAAGHRFGFRAFAVAAGAALGLMPSSWIAHHVAVFLVWLAALVYFVAGALSPRRRTEMGARRWAVLCRSALLWLIAPLTGPVGILLLRLPLIQLAVIYVVQKRRLARLAATFPATIG